MINEHPSESINQGLSVELKSFRQSKPRSTRIFFDHQGNRVTERIYQVPNQPDINKTTVETAELVINKTRTNLGTQNRQTYKTLQITSHIDDSNTTVTAAESITTGPATATTTIQPQLPMRDPLLQPSNQSQKINLTSDVEYLGVLLDAGRHYFPTDWIYRLLDHLELLGFNLLHFRLTDDQAFNVRFDCHPELAQPATGSNGQVYTPTELRQLVAYAKQKGIIIMPEINVPGHAGGWAGAIPRLVLPCAGFICTAGYGLALNASHPQLIPILREVLIEVKDIFSTTPFFHLGGDELEMSWDCFRELGINTLDYTNFENDLGIMLKEIGISHDQVVRWEMTGQDPINEQDDDVEKLDEGGKEKNISRVKGIDHYWYSRRYQDISNNTKSPPRVFCSHGLYFDTNQNEDAWTIYNLTRTMMSHQYKPIAVIAGTFELGVDYWLDRNVIGRLLAVAIGSSKENYDLEDDFVKRYLALCMSLDLPHEMCAMFGAPRIDYDVYRLHWTTVSTSWKENLCARLVTTEIESTLTFSEYHIALNLREANARFWDNFVKVEPDLIASSYVRNASKPINSSQELQVIKLHTVKHTGIILDLVNAGSYTIESHRRILAIIDYLGILGFTLLQLRIMNNYGFAVQLENHGNIFYGQSITSYRPWTMKVVKEIIRHAATRGIQVMPELSVAHHAGGWYKSAPMVNCPKHHCELGKGLTMNTTSGAILPILASVLRELRQSFTSPFVHLGYDERDESMACAHEADGNVDFEKIEHKITRLLEHNFIPLNMVVRWENDEQRVYKGRAGTITHYRTSTPTPTENATDAFITADLQLNDPLSRLETAWDLYQYVQKLVSFKPLGILASLVTVQDTMLKYLNARQRILAVAIGLSANNLSESEFRNIFFGLCKEVRNNGCELYGRIRNSDEASALMKNEQTLRHTNTCMSRLENVTVVRPREGILVENGTNINEMKTVLGIETVIGI